MSNPESRIKINESAAIRTVMDLIAIPGGSGSESGVAINLKQQLEKSGVPSNAIRFDNAHRKSPAGGDCGNLIVRLKGRVKGPGRLLMAHMDTVPLAVNSVPAREGDIIRPKSHSTALGGDNRAGCAVVLTAVREVLQRNLPHPPLTLVFTVQEEIGLRGARFLDSSKLGQPELCFNWDGSDPARLINAAVGATNLSITIQGVASHAGAHPERGVNAGVVAALALARLQQEGWHGLVLRGKNRGASNLGEIRGGEATNVVMPEVQLQAEARSHQPAFRKRIVREYRRAFEWAVRQIANDSNCQAQLCFEEDTRYEAFRIPAHSPCIQVAEAAISSLGLTPEVRNCDGGLDANWMARHGFPAVTLGCGQYGIHTVDETLNVPQFLDACRIAVILASTTG
ncbi:MAG: M20/M25/M40 family metallo-hydrolase [Planctomycetaceae bacterium]|nr:M20/M25/M40 family metallo-hydrolase [Planctomycetaceae bacterium]